jgi:hypothetical protein
VLLISCLLVLLAWPITPVVVNWLRHRPHNLEPGVGTQHIVVAGVIAQVLLLAGGVGVFIADWLR